MSFVDEVVIRVQSGAGGNGCVSFRREKYIPRGGPNGGNGGRGGSVYLVANRNKTSLLDFKFQPIFRAKRGDHGKGSDKDGRGGADLFISVPLGTLVYDGLTGEQLADLIEESVPYLVVPGGKGGRGNKTFATSTNRAPRMATPGEPGENHDLRLELRLIADIGLIGLPNAGKSSLLRVISKARPKVAEYAFTTLEPHLGVVHHKGQSIVVADLPGLIEGASHGLGLGHQFLRHASRNRVLLHLVDVSEPPETIRENIRLIRHELESHDESLARREELLAFTKIDLISKSSWRIRKAGLKKMGLQGFFISSHSGTGVTKLLDHLASRMKQWGGTEDAVKNIEHQPDSHPREIY